MVYVLLMHNTPEGIVYTYTFNLSKGILYTNAYCTYTNTNCTQTYTVHKGILYIHKHMMYTKAYCTQIHTVHKSIHKYDSQSCS